MSLSYRLTIKDIAAYQHAVKQRLEATSGVSKLRRLVTFVAAGILAGCVLVVIDRNLAQISGRAPEPLAIVSGIMLGFAVTMAGQWYVYLSHRRNLFRPDGPALAPQTIDDRDDMLTIESAFLKSAYQWSAFTGVSQHGDIVIVWLEPASGIVIPRSAFAHPDLQQSFIDRVQRRIKETAVRSGDVE